MSASAPLFRPDPLKLKLVIYSKDKDGKLVPPRTKKNSPIIVHHLERAVLVPSEAYREWHAGAAKLLRPQIPELRRLLAERHGFDILPIKFPIHMSAVFYRHAYVGDLFGFLDGIADFLNDDLRPKSQRDADPGNPLKILDNDKWIYSVDGSRLLKDSARPRIELTLQEIR